MSEWQTSVTTQMQDSNDILRQLLSVVQSIQGSLDAERKTAKENLTVEVVNQEENIPVETTKVEVAHVWLTPEQIKKYEQRHMTYTSECQTMGKELDYLISHNRIVGQLNNVVKATVELKKNLLHTGPLQSLKTALAETTGIRTREALQGVQFYLTSVSTSIAFFLGSLDTSTKRASQLRHLRQTSRWEKLNSEGQKRIAGFLDDGDLGACLKYLYTDLFKNLEKVMQDVSEELLTLERKSVNYWLTSEKKSEVEQWYKKYTNHISSFQVPTSSPPTCSDEEMEKFKISCMDHRKEYGKVEDQLRRIIGHYERVGGDKEVIEASQFLKEKLCDPLEPIEWYFSRVSSDPLLLRESLTEAVNRFGWLHFAVYRFQRSLYLHKHAFYFHNVEQWVARLWNGWSRMIRFIREDKSIECLTYMQDKLFPSLEEAILGIDKELEMFREKSLPYFLAEEIDRDTTQYANITTIATFFSSVTATTLQISYSLTLSSRLLPVVNLFWFVSLVFSVSSGVSSLLGLMWRKSSIYYTITPPKLIRIWLEKAHMVFLIVAAFSFIVGLNLLAFLSPQSRFESVTTVAFTGLHILGLLFVISWFFLESEQKYAAAKWILHPLQQFKGDLQLQREIWWAFGNDRKVGRLTYEMSPWIDKTRGKPYIISKIIRCLSLSIATFWSRTKQLPATLRDFAKIWKCFWLPCRRPDGIADAETGNADVLENDKPAEPLSPLEYAKREFQDALKKEIGDAGLVDEAMKMIRAWENPYVQDSEERLTRLRSLLWGYPELVKKVDDKGGLIDLQQQVVEANASSSPEHLLAGRAGGTRGFDFTDLQTSPLSPALEEKSTS